MCQKIFIFISVTLAVADAAAVAPLYETKSGGVSGEYLLLMKRHENVKERLSEVTRYIHSLGGIWIESELSHGKFGVLHLITSRLDRLHTLRTHPHVELIEQNHIEKLASETPSDTCMSQSSGKEIWGLSRISAVNRPNYQSAKYQYNSQDGTDVDVYVIDSGVNLNHVDFGGRAFWGYTARAVRYEGDDDKNGHGTHVAATVAGTTYGVAKQANIIAVKVFNASGKGTGINTIEGLLWAVADNEGKSTQSGKAKKAVINMSLGSFASIVGYAEEALIQAAVEGGIPVVVSAGNDGTDACIKTPARMSSVITVGATNSSDYLADFSNYGPCVNILAPGVGIKSAWIGSSTSVSTIDGTSMATPHVVGAAARILSRSEDRLTVDEVKAVLMDYASSSKISFSGHPATIAHTGPLSTPNKLLHIGCLTGT